MSADEICLNSKSKCTVVLVLIKVKLRFCFTQKGQQQSKDNVKPPTASQLALKVYKEKGFFGFYKGGAATLSRDVFFSAMYFPMFAYFNSLVCVYLLDKCHHFYKFIYSCSSLS
jgi:hypothetical protein